jgi:hypothetical protein
LVESDKCCNPYINQPTNQPNIQLQTIMTSIVSASGKYQVDYLPDPNPDCTRTATTTIYTSSSTTTNTSAKYRLVRLIHVETHSTVFEYKQHLSHPLDCQFFTQNGVEWFLGSREYMSQLFVNLETGDYYDNCTVNDLEDSGYERKHTVEDDECYDSFIWADTRIEPNGMCAFVEGCYWACPYEQRVYDLSHLSTGWIPIDIDTACLNDKIEITPDGILRYYLQTQLVMEATIVNGKWVDRQTVDGSAIIAREKNRRDEAARTQKADTQSNYIQLFCDTDTNVFKEWLRGTKQHIDHCEIIRNCPDWVIEALLSAEKDDIISIECHGAKSGAKYNSNVIEFLVNVRMDNITDQTPDENPDLKFQNVKSAEHRFANIGQFVVVNETTKEQWNRLLSAQIKCITCSRFYPNYEIPKSMLENVDLIFSFTTKQFAIHIRVKVFLDDGPNDTRIFKKDSLVQITIDSEHN